MRSALRVDEDHGTEPEADGRLPSASGASAPDAGATGLDAESDATSEDPSPDAEDPSPEDLAEAAAAGDARAFERLVRRYYARIHRWALVVTGDLDEADDVTQETLLKLQRTLPQYRREAGFATWLYRVTRSVALDRSRRTARRDRKKRRFARRVGGGLPARDAPDVVARIEAKRLAGRVRHFLEDLPLRQRETFDLIDLQGHTPSEAADMLELKAGTVRAHLFRARRALRTRLLEVEPGGSRTAGEEET